jgi:THO complex subunit 2
VPASTPSGPRAMGPVAGDSSRTKIEPMSVRDRHRDSIPPPNKPPPPPPVASASSNQMELRPSLRSRIGGDPPLSFRPTGSREDDDREFHRKRTASGMSALQCDFTVKLKHSHSDRDLDNEVNPGPGNDLGTQPPKKPRTNRRGYSSNQHAIARKFLPIDPSAGDKSQRRPD